jgi:hypothetical protein
MKRPVEIAAAAAAAALSLIAWSAVGLVHTRKAGIKYKKPTSPNSW